MMAATSEAISKMTTRNALSSTEIRTAEKTKRKVEIGTNTRMNVPGTETNARSEAERKRLEDIIAILTANITRAEAEAAESRMSVARADAQRIEALAVADAERLARVEAESICCQRGGRETKSS
jgi:hypothetical protein